MNVQFDGTELSSLGFSIASLNGRGLSEWKIESVEIPSRASAADLSSQFMPGSTSIEGMLSADVDLWTNYTHAKWLERLDSLKAVLNPKKGFRKLVISGDSPTRFRWARFAHMGLVEQRPVFKLPHHRITIDFQNYEPYWRQTAATVNVTVPGTVVPNIGNEDTAPSIDLLVAAPIAATTGPRIQPVTLAIIDDFQLNWKGMSSSGELRAGDLLTIDGETLTATLRPGGVGTPTDVVRYYDYSGPGAYASNGFPSIKVGGSIVTYIHPRISSLVIRNDALYL